MSIRYTIGTLTGYVHITATPTTSASASATADAAETYPTSPQSRFKREASTIPAAWHTNNLQQSTSTEVVFETVTAAPTTTSTVIVWAPADKSVAEDSQRVKRDEVGLDPAQEGGEEWRTSVNRRGQTVVLVKTTRPLGAGTLHPARPQGNAALTCRFVLWCSELCGTDNWDIR